MSLTIVRWDASLRCAPHILALCCKEDMRSSAYKIGLIILLVVIAPYIYSKVQGYWALNLVTAIQLISEPSRLVVSGIIIGMQFIGAFFSAMLLAFPVGLLMRERTYIYGLLLAVSPLVTLLYIHISYGPEWSSRDWLFRVSEYVSIIVTFTFAAIIGGKAIIWYKKCAT